MLDYTISIRIRKDQVQRKRLLKVSWHDLVETALLLYEMENKLNKLKGIENVDKK